MAVLWIHPAAHHPPSGEEGIRRALPPWSIRSRCLLPRHHYLIGVLQGLS